MFVVMQEFPSFSDGDSDTVFGIDLRGIAVKLVLLGTLVVPLAGVVSSILFTQVILNLCITRLVFEDLIH